MTEELTEVPAAAGFDLDHDLAGLDVDGFTIVGDNLTEDQLVRSR